MTALSINPPYPIFTDIDGQPLEDGYVWIGTANLDPQTNPINVYWDAALTLPAAQPIRTLAGYPSNSGTPARVYVNSDYSIRVMNRNGSTVYSAPSKTEAIGDIDSAIVSFIQAGTGAVTRTAQSKMREVFSVLDFGADPAGSATANAAAIQAAIDACPVGGTLQGLGLTFPCTGVEVNKAITVEGVILDMVELIPSQTSQDAFTITSSDAKLINCGAIISEFTMPNTTNSAGVYCVGNSNVLIDGGEWIGSISKDYTPGNWRGPIYIEGGADNVVQNTITRDAYGDGLWFNNSARGQCLNNKAYNAGGSEIVFYSDYGLMQGNITVGNNVGGNSGISVGGDYVTIANNEIIDASGWGISHGEFSSLGGLIVGNTVRGYGKYTAQPNKSGILSQYAQGLVITGNSVLAPTVGCTGPGISIVNTPDQVVCSNNYIENTGAEGIYFFDSAGVSQVEITNNTIVNPVGWHIYVGNPFKSNVSGNTLKNFFLSGSYDFFMYFQFTSAIPKFVRIVDNVMESNTVSYTNNAIFLDSTLTSATQMIINGNFIGRWTGAPYSTGRNCLYDVRNNNYGTGAKSGLVTLTNGGTTTVVTTAQVTQDSVVMLELANAAASTLNPVYRISTLANGSFTITHTAGTVAGEQLKWTII